MLLNGGAVPPPSVARGPTVYAHQHFPLKNYPWPQWTCGTVAIHHYSPLFTIFTIIHNYSQLFTIIHHYSPLFTIIHHYSLLFSIIHHYSPIFTMIHHIYHYSPLFTIIHHYSPSFTIIHHYSPVFTIIHHLPAAGRCPIARRQRA